LPNDRSTTGLAPASIAALVARGESIHYVGVWKTIETVRKIYVTVQPQARP
jgi:hypothetical protein